MPFIERNNGVIVGEYVNLQPGFAEEFLSENDPDLLAFRNPKPSNQAKLQGLISAAQNALEANPLPVEYRLAIYQLEAACDIAFARNDETTVIVAIQGFTIPENAPISQDQRAAVEAFKGQMLNLFGVS